jgi:hypothetical protein
MRSRSPAGSRVGDAGGSTAAARRTFESSSTSITCGTDPKPGIDAGIRGLVHPGGAVSRTPGAPRETGSRGLGSEGALRVGAPVRSATPIRIEPLMIASASSTRRGGRGRPGNDGVSRARSLASRSRHDTSVYEGCLRPGLPFSLCVDAGRRPTALMSSLPADRCVVETKSPRTSPSSDQQLAHVPPGRLLLAGCRKCISAAAGGGLDIPTQLRRHRSTSQRKPVQRRMQSLNPRPGRCGLP